MPPTGVLFAAVAMVLPFLPAGEGLPVARGACLAGAVRLLGWGRLRPALAPAAGLEASWAMERSLAMRWVMAFGVTSMRGINMLEKEKSGKRLS